MRFYNEVDIDKMVYLLLRVKHELREALKSNEENNYKIWTLTKMVRFLEREIKASRLLWNTPCLNIPFREEKTLKLFCLDIRNLKVSRKTIKDIGRIDQKNRLS